MAADERSTRCQAGIGWSADSRQISEARVVAGLRPAERLKPRHHTTLAYFVTTWSTAFDVLGAKFESPAYTALIGW